MKGMTIASEATIIQAPPSPIKPRLANSKVAYLTGSKLADYCTVGKLSVKHRC
jgi:hypothetical protein